MAYLRLFFSLYTHFKKIFFCKIRASFLEFVIRCVFSPPEFSVPPLLILVLTTFFGCKRVSIYKYPSLSPFSPEFIYHPATATAKLFPSLDDLGCVCVRAFLFHNHLPSLNITFNYTLMRLNSDPQLRNHFSNTPKNKIRLPLQKNNKFSGQDRLLICLFFIGSKQEKKEFH